MTWHMISEKPPISERLLVTGFAHTVTPTRRWYFVCCFNGVQLYDQATGDDIFELPITPTHWQLIDEPI